MIFMLPVVGWLIGFVLAFGMAVPFYYCWNALAPIYFAAWVPPIFLQLPFWHIVGLFVIISILKAMLVPNWGSSNTTNVGKK